MTQEDKELLLKDLCARLPYGVKVQMADGAIEELLNINVNTFICNGLKGLPQPYLFPLSSMTEEQKEEMSSFDPFQTAETKTLGQWAFHLVDFYNKHHFDYRGLIPKGLAIDATGLNVY